MRTNRNDDPESWAGGGRWHIVRQEYQPIPTGYPNYKAGVIWETRDIGDDPASALDSGLRSAAGSQKGTETISRKANAKYEAIYKAYGDRKLHHLGEPDYTSRQKVAEQFQVNPKTVDRAIRRIRKEK